MCVCLCEGEIDSVLLFECVSLWSQGCSALSTGKILSWPDGLPQGRYTLMINFSPFLSFILTHLCRVSDAFTVSWRWSHFNLSLTNPLCPTYCSVTAGRQIVKRSWNIMCRICAHGHKVFHDSYHNYLLCLHNVSFTEWNRIYKRSWSRREVVGLTAGTKRRTLYICMFYSRMGSGLVSESTLVIFQYLKLQFIRYVHS